MTLKPASAVTVPLYPVVALLIAGLAVSALTGCQREPVSLQGQIELLQPSRIEVLQFTKPRSWDGDETPDGLEVVLRPLDAFGDQTKAVGTFRFELHLYRKASSDPRGERIGFWEVPVDTRKAQVQHWDPITRYYSFRLQWDGPTPQSGKYVLHVTYISPWGKRLADTYVFEIRQPKLRIKEKIETQWGGSS